MLQAACIFSPAQLDQLLSDLQAVVWITGKGWHWEHAHFVLLVGLRVHICIYV